MGQRSGETKIGWMQSEPPRQPRSKKHWNGFSAGNHTRPPEEQPVTSSSQPRCDGNYWGAKRHTSLPIALCANSSVPALPSETLAQLAGTDPRVSSCADGCKRPSVSCTCERTTRKYRLGNTGPAKGRKCRGGRERRKPGQQEGSRQLLKRKVPPTARRKSFQSGS